jgi:uncharacterized protein (TIGR02466 family)
MKIENLFPIPVFFDQFPRQLNSDEIEYFRNLEMRGNVSNTTSKETYVLQHPALKELSDFITEKVKYYFDEIYKPLDDVSIYITQSWINETRIGQEHHVHSHPNSIFSGVFYINADINFDKITFIKNQSSDIQIQHREFHKYNSNAWYWEVGSGALLLFPSYLKHSVGPVLPSPIRESRISLSFNTFIKGHLCPGEQLAELYL